MSFLYRKLEKNDLKTIFEMGKDQFGLPSQFSWDWSLAKLDEYLDNKFGTGIVCFGDELVGFALAQNKYSEQKPDVAWLTYIMVSSKYLSLGIGKELYNKLVVALKGIGANEITIDVYEDNVGFLEFFKKRGFNIKEKWLTLSTKI